MLNPIAPQADTKATPRIVCIVSDDMPLPIRCPGCYCRDCVPSLPTRRFDRLFVSMHRVPYECRVCGKRFRRFDRQEAEQVAATMTTMAL